MPEIQHVIVIGTPASVRASDVQTMPDPLPGHLWLHEQLDRFPLHDDVRQLIQGVLSRMYFGRKPGQSALIPDATDLTMLTAADRDGIFARRHDLLAGFSGYPRLGEFARAIRLLVEEIVSQKGQRPAKMPASVKPMEADPAMEALKAAIGSIPNPSLQNAVRLLVREDHYRWSGTAVRFGEASSYRVVLLKKIASALTGVSDQVIDTLAQNPVLADVPNILRQIKSRTWEEFPGRVPSSASVVGVKNGPVSAPAWRSSVPIAHAGQKKLWKRGIRG